ncbi:MAG: hypothetical protein AAF492_20545, partial [Verrucomicrobiota bacterium]
LVKKFPQHAALFDGWSRVPTEPDDPNNPVPINNPTQPPEKLAEAYVNASNRLQDDPGDFDSEDHFGLFVQTADKPTPGNPVATSDEEGAGLHNTMHNRFGRNGSPVHMGRPEVNIENQMFWRLHGWIDSVWSGYRAHHGLSDDDPDYVNAIREGARHMGIEDILFPAAPPSPTPAPPAPAMVSTDHGGHGGHHHPPTSIEVPPAVMEQILKVSYACPEDYDELTAGGVWKEK